MPYLWRPYRGPLQRTSAQMRHGAASEITIGLGILGVGAYLLLHETRSLKAGSCDVRLRAGWPRWNSQGFVQTYALVGAQESRGELPDGSASHDGPSPIWAIRSQEAIVIRNLLQKSHLHTHPLAPARNVRYS